MQTPMNSAVYGNLTNAELIQHIDNSEHATPLVRELANRLDRAMVALKDEFYLDEEGEHYDPRPEA